MVVSHLIAALPLCLCYLIDPAMSVIVWRSPVVRQQYSDKEIFTALRKAAKLAGQPLSVGKYDAVRDDVDGPSAIRIIQRFETWSAACDAARVKPGMAKRSYTQQWSEKDVIGWVRRYLKASKNPTFADFTEWLRDQKGAPSGQTARNIAGSWSEMKGKAARKR